MARRAKYETCAWWSPKDIKGNPAVRKEVQGTDWSIFAKALRKTSAENEILPAGDTMYHASNPHNRYGIDKEGLRVRYSQDEDNQDNPPPGLYMSPKPSSSQYDDVWEVHTKGLHMEPDDPGQMHEFKDVGGSYLTTNDIERSRLKLHRPATKHYVGVGGCSMGSSCPVAKGMEKTSIAVAPCECGHPQTDHSKNRGTCSKCWDNFMDHFQDFYKGTGPEVDYCKRFKGDRTKTAAMEAPTGHTLYRGLHFGLGSPEDIERLHKDPKRYLGDLTRYQHGEGIHWTEDYDVAHRFAMGRDADDTYGDEFMGEGQEDHKSHGMVLEAQVHPRHHIDFDSEEGQGYAMSDGIFDPGSHEQETTVRDKGKVHIHKLHAVSEGDDRNPYDRVTTQDVRMHRQAAMVDKFGHIGAVKHLVLYDFASGAEPEADYCKGFSGSQAKTAAEGDKYKDIMGDEHEEVHGFTGRVRDGHLENPMDHTTSWHHGTPKDWGKEPEDEEDEEYNPEDRYERHWNTHLGTHWTSLPEVAKKFANGMYDQKRSSKEIAAEPGHIHTAQLGIKNPKVYNSEFDMDKEAYDHAKKHFDDPDEEDEDSGDLGWSPPALTHGSSGDHAQWLSHHPESEEIAHSFKSKLQSEGHDGIVYGNEMEGPHHRDFTGVKPGENSVVRGHPCAIPFNESQQHNVRSRPANEPEREQLKMFGRFGHLVVVGVKRLAPFTAPTYQDEDKLRGPSEKATEGGPVTIFGGNSNPQAVAKKKAIHERLYNTMSAKMETDPELKDWAARRGPRTGPKGTGAYPDNMGYEHPAHYEGQDDAHVQLGYHIKKAIDDWAGSSTSGVDSQAKQLAVQKHFGLPESTLDDVRNRYGAQSPEAKAGVEAHYQEHKPFLHHFIQSVYDDTQAHLKKHGVTHMLLHRGLAAQNAETAPDWMRPPVKSVEKITPEQRESNRRNSYGYNRSEKFGDDQTHVVHYDQKDDESQVRGGVWSQKQPKVTSNPASSWTTNKRTANEFADRSFDTNKSMVMSAKVPAERVWSTAHTGPGCLGEREAIVLGGPGEVSLTHRGPWPSHLTANPRKFQGLMRKQAHMAPLPNIDHDHEDWIKTEEGDLDMEGRRIYPGGTTIDHFGHLRLASDSEDYGMSHRPTEGPPIHNLLGGEGEAAFAPKDIYNRMSDYAGREPADFESMDAIQNARHDKPLHQGQGRDHTEFNKKYPDNPIPSTAPETDEHFVKRQEDRRNGEHFVTVYRAAPKGVKTINHGDWVSPSKTYARGEGRVSEDKTKDQPVYKARVKAKHVLWAGDSLNEFGYFGPEAKTEVHFRGGKNAERADQSHEGAKYLKDADGNDISDLEGNRPDVNHDGTLDLYHATSKENAREIATTGRWKSREGDDVFFSTKPASDYISGFGDHVVKARIHPKLLHINDAFRDGEIHFSVKRQHLRPEHIQGYGALGKYASATQPHEGAMRVSLAADEIVVPRNIDTLRDSTCAVCFAPETLVRAKAGYVPIVSIESGEEVLSSDGHWHRVLEVMERDYDGMAYWLRSSMMTEPVLVTPEHPIGVLVSHHVQGGPCLPKRCGHFVSNKSGRKGNEHHTGWVEVEQLSSSSFVMSRVLDDVVPVSIIRVPDQFFPGHGWKIAARMDRREFELTDDFLWMIGMYLAEGSTTTRKILFSLHEKEVEYQERLVRLFEGYGYRPVVRPGYYEDGKGVQVEVNSSMLSEWFPIWLGHGCQNKTIPAELLNLPLDRLEHVWQGVLDGDGTNGYDQCKQTSEVLALQLVEIALRRGGVPTVSLEYPQGKKPTFQVAGTTRSRLGTKTGRIKKGTWKFLGETLAQIRKVEPTLYAGKVYNLRVEGDPTYVVQNLLVHNCGSSGTMNKDRCSVCGYLSTPEAFQAPDLSLAGQVRDQLGIGNPGEDDGDQQGAPGAPQGLGSDEGAMGAPGGEDGAVGAPGEAGEASSLICDACGATFDSEQEEQDLDEPYLSPAARIEPDVSALGVPDDMDAAREIAAGENMTGQDEGVGFQEGQECPTCGEGTLMPYEGDDEDGLGPEDEMAGAEGDGLDPGADPQGEEVPPEGEEGAPEGIDGGPSGDEGQGPSPVEGEEDDEQIPPGDEGEVPPGDEEQEEDDDEDDEGDEPPFPRRQPKESSTMAYPQGAPRRPSPAQGQARPAPVRRTVTAGAPNPVAQERQRLFDTLGATVEAINRQADLLQRQDQGLKAIASHLNMATRKLSELTLRNEGLERQMAVVANASGLALPLAEIGAACNAKVAALYRRANPANPAQPVPEPGSEPPLVTSQEAMQAAGRDDVTQLGASPVADVAAGAVTSVDTPYGELLNQPVGLTRTDVTSPVAGTETATPPEMTVIPVDTRIGPNLDNPQVAFPFTIGPVGAPAQPYSGPSVGNPPTTAANQRQVPRRQGEPGVAVHPRAQVNGSSDQNAQAHYIAAVNLARLRARVGISNEEPFESGIKIASSMSDAQINAEAQGLSAVASHMSQAPQAPPFQPGPAFPPVTASAPQAYPYMPEGRVMVPHLASSSNGGSILPSDPSFQAGKYGPGPGSEIQGTTMFAPRAEEMGWESPV